MQEAEKELALFDQASMQQVIVIRRLCRHAKASRLLSEMPTPLEVMKKEATSKIPGQIMLSDPLPSLEILSSKKLRNVSPGKTRRKQENFNSRNTRYIVLPCI